MISNLSYFRPDRRFLDEDLLLLKEKFSYTIKDEFTFAENTIQVPIYLTVFQHHTPNVFKKRRLPSRLDKICFYLIGSLQEPPMIDYSDRVDRIEFHGHIGFEEPIFNVIKSLKGLKKVAFFLDPKKQGNYIQPSRVNNSNSTNCKEIKQDDVSYCTNVTSLKLILDREDDSSEEQDFRNLSMAKKETLRVMIIRLLRRVVDLCPNIRRLTVDVPNWKGIRNVIDEIREKITYLKPTKVLLVGSYISVRKSAESAAEAEYDISVEVVESDASRPKDDDQSSCCEEDTTIVVDEVGSDDQVDPDNTDDPTNPRLEDMSKLLGSILGIPTSSSGNSSPLISSSSSSLINFPLTDSNGSSSHTESEITTTTNTNTNRSLSSALLNQITERPIKSSSSPEIISYAAAAAAASTKSISSNLNANAIKKNGYGNNSLHLQQKNTHNNEGSRKTLRDGEGSSSSTQPSIPNVADLGKPVVVSVATATQVL